MAAPLSAAALRRELQARALASGRRHELSAGRSPSVIFAEDDHGGHGNFHPESYRAIRAEPAWARRLGKAHTGSLRALPRADWRWRELDCAASSDALLMNIFCHPAVFDDGRVAALMGVTRGVRPCFGVRAHLPLLRGLADTTEIDMQLGSLLVEAKLTESGFQTAPPALVERSCDLERVFDVAALPRTGATIVGEQWDEALGALVAVTRGQAGNFLSYQLIRGTLAAHAQGAAFCVLCDARRLDLVEACHRVLQAVRSAELRCRLQLLTWQELAGVLPASLTGFLASKYGIWPA